MSAQSRSLFLALALLLVLAAGTTALAQSSASFDLRWHVVGSGGGLSSSASYRVNGTIGQSLASQPTSSSASFALGAGYWIAGAGTSIYLPVVLKNWP